MILTKIGTDYVKINEDNLNDESLQDIQKIHLIHLDFEKPTLQKVRKVLEYFPNTNRFVIENNVKFYNSVLRETKKKYYIMNKPGLSFISFFKKNNKVLPNLDNFSNEEYNFIVDNCFPDILYNCEVIMIDKTTFEDYEETFEKWNGNVIIYDE